LWKIGIVFALALLAVVFVAPLHNPNFNQSVRIFQAEQSVRIGMTEADVQTVLSQAGVQWRFDSPGERNGQTLYWLKDKYANFLEVQYREGPVTSIRVDYE
jgi:hypothetical protein